MSCTCWFEFLCFTLFTLMLLDNVIDQLIDQWLDNVLGGGHFTISYKYSK